MNAAVVIPLFNEEETLVSLTEGILEHIGLEDFRILYVDDGSTDDSFAVLEKLRAEHPCIDVLRFSRNAGKTQALASAFRRVDADAVITMDADLQDDPAELPAMLAALDGNADLVCGWKKHRHDPIQKTFPSKIFNGWMSLMFGLGLHDINTGYKIMRGEIAPRLPLDGNLHRFIPVLAQHLGYSVAEIPVHHRPRLHGRSKYGAKRYVEGIHDALLLWSRIRFRGGAGLHDGPPPEPDGLIALDTTR